MSPEKSPATSPETSPETGKRKAPKITLHEGDLPDGLNFTEAVAVDSETMGLRPERDRLCVVQLSAGDGTAHLVRFQRGIYDAPNLCRLLLDPTITKIFHYARFDMAVCEAYLDVIPAPVYCTKIASRLVRTYTDRHGLADLCRELLGFDLSKKQQSSDWGADSLTREQQLYAASDVLYLHRIRSILDARLVREERSALAQACFEFLAPRARLDLIGYGSVDIFSH